MFNFILTGRISQKFYVDLGNDESESERKEDSCPGMGRDRSYGQRLIRSQWAQENLRVTCESPAGSLAVTCEPLASCLHDL